MSSLPILSKVSLTFECIRKSFQSWSMDSPGCFATLRMSAMPGISKIVPHILAPMYEYLEMVPKAACCLSAKDNDVGTTDCTEKSFQGSILD